MAAISANDRAERRATIPLKIKEIITDGPAKRAAACPLSTNIPAPGKKINVFDFIHRL